MELIQKFIDLLAKIPDWVLLYVIPAAILLIAVGFVFVKKRGWYFSAAILPVAAGFLTAYAKYPALALAYLALEAVVAAVCSLLFLIPVPERESGDRHKSRAERIYQKFHEELSEKPYIPRSAMPPKVCCFEEGTNATASESGMSLDYADSLLDKLRARDMSAGDRLEAEELSRRLALYREKPLNADERNSLNDCLAAILKLTAKYQL